MTKKTKIRAAKVVETRTMKVAAMTGMRMVVKVKARAKVVDEQKSLIGRVGCK